MPGETQPVTLARLPRSIALIAAYLAPATASTRTIEIAHFGDFSGPLRTFGPNTRGVLKAAEAKINQAGGITLPDGETGFFRVTSFDSACSFDQAKAVVKRLAAGPFILGIGPTCSGTAQPLFGQLQYDVNGPLDECVATRGWNAASGTMGTANASAGDSLSASGDGYNPTASCLQFPIFTDTSIRPGLAARSDWAFRQVPNEATMYDILWEWVSLKPASESR
eukprot:4979974-Prymnesium_polylepis.2